MKTYKVLASQVFSYASKPQTIRKQDERRLSIEMKCLTKAAGCILLDHKSYELITEELQMTPLAEQKTLAAAYRANGMVRTAKTNSSLRPQGKTVKKENTIGH